MCLGECTVLSWGFRGEVTDWIYREHGNDPPKVLRFSVVVSGIPPIFYG